MGILNKYNNIQSDRTRLFVKNIISGFGIKGISILTQLMLVPLTINYISPELYGIWLTLSSIVQWISFFDVGLGNGLRNKLGEALALKQFKRGKIFVSTTYVVIASIFSILGTILFFLIPLIDWSKFLNVSILYQDTIIQVIRILLVSFCVQIVLKIISNVIQAFQLYALSSLLDAMGNVLSLIAVYLLAISMSPSLPNVALAFSLAPILVYFIFSIFAYAKKFSVVAPNVLYFRKSSALSLLDLGGKFFLIQISGIVLFQMVNILISKLCGPETVTEYNIAYKYFNVVLMLLMIIISPLWSAFTEAYTQNDKSWMFSIYNKLLKLFVLSVFALLVMVVLSSFVYDLWVGSKVSIPFSLSVLIAIYILINVWGQMHAVLLNGMGKIKFQVCYSLVIMIFFLPLAFYFGSNWGVNGIVFSMIFVNMPCVFWSPFQVRKVMEGTAKGIWNK